MSERTPPSDVVGARDLPAEALTLLREARDWMEATDDVPVPAHDALWGNDLYRRISRLLMEAEKP